MERKVKFQNESMFQRMFENVDKSGSFLDRNEFSSEHSTSCGAAIRARKNIKEFANELKSGYEAMEDNSFYMQPEMKNTFHNYPVRQDDGMYCSENHQVFNNMTRRKVQYIPEEINADVSNIIKENEPKLLKLSPCKILTRK